MADFLDMLEAMNAADASVERLYAGEGVGLRSRRRADDPAYVQRLTEATRFVSEVVSGRRPVRDLREMLSAGYNTPLSETMTRSDFPLLFGDILDRTVLGAYEAAPPTWPNIAARRTVRDFRTVNRFSVQGGDSGALAEVKEVTEYPEVPMAESRYQVSVKKYGRRMSFSWEVFINDDLDQLRDAPRRLGRAAARSEDRFATDLYIGAAGPDAALYTAPNGNIVTSNPALSIDALATAMTQFATMTDTYGEPIVLDAVVLVVPPALEIKALSILNATELRITGAAAGAGANTEMQVRNWMQNRVRLVVNPYIPVLASSNQNTSWFLFAQPTSDRPALEMDFLRGHESPELFQRLPDAQRVGGGTDILDGSFDLDVIDYKVRHVFGGGIIDPKMTVASNGSGS